MTKKNEYTSSNIRVLEGLEAVRVRPGMYIGSTDERGLHHLVYEIVDNSIDEAMAGRCDTIDVVLNKDGSCEVTDNGVGIPVAPHPQTGKSTLETVLTVLHAGGKFDSDAYEFSGGLHGVGVAVVNALSKKLEATIKRDGFVWNQTFERGNSKGEIKKGKKTKETGTTIKFYPDEEIFDTVEFDRSTLATRFREMAFLNAGVTINLIDKTKTEERIDTFTSEGGLSSYVEYLNRNKTALDKNIAHFKGKSNGMEFEIALQYTDSYSENIVGFANNIKTPEGGTHITGFKSALTKSLNDFARENKILKEKDNNFAGDDLREGLTAIVSVKLQNAQFEGQTKSKLGNSEVNSELSGFLSEEFSIFLNKNKRYARKILDKALKALQAKEAARKARELTRKKNKAASATLPGKLADCSSKDPKLTELYIVEGDSAAGSSKLGRNSKFQAILPLKGKILNVEKATMSRMLSSGEIKALITAIGGGVGKEFDIDKVRYGKIVIMTDADVDGAHIATLLLTFMYRYMKPLIDEGRVFLANPPLYKFTYRGKEEYLYDVETLEKKLSKIPEDSNYTVSRFKGLGEMNPEQLWDTTMNPKTRTLLRLVEMTPPDETDDVFVTLMGSSVADRREFIEENSQLSDKELTTHA